MMMARILQVSIFLAAHARGEDCFKLLEQLCPQEASSAGDHTASGCRSCLADHARELSSCSGTQQQVYCGDGECHSKLEALCHSRPTTHKCKVSDLRKKCNSCVQLNRPELVSATATASGSWAGPTVHNGTACDDTSIQWYCGTESKSKLSKAVGYGLTVVSLICWGSWSNSAKEADKQQVPFPHFYTDYAASIFFSSIAFWVIFAKGELDVATQGNPVGHWRALAGLGAGAVFNVANVLMVHGINVAGLSIAFPLAIGTALVLGTVLIYIVDTCNRPTNAGLLFVGVGFGFVAVVMIALADRLKRQTQSSHSGLAQPINDAGAGGKAAASPAKAAVICFVSGVLMSCWPPLQSYAQDPGATDSLNPYFGFVLLSAATLLTSIKPSPIAIFLYWCEEQGSSSSSSGSEPSTIADYFSLSPTQHAYGFAGGFVWAIGTLSNLVGGSVVDLAISYSMGQAAPLVAMGWGVLYYGEFSGASQAAYAALAAMVVLYGVAIGFIASSK